MAREDAPVNPVRVEREVTLWVAIALMLASHACLLGWGAAVHSPSLDELGHLPAGLSHWQLARFDLYRVNPPLVRMVAAAPVVFCMPKIRWYSYSESGQTRPEFQFGRQMIAAEGARTFWYFTLSRWACIPFSLLGAYTCFLWARELYGDVAGLLAAALWCFSPGILGNAQMITPDVGAAALAAGSGYTFWRWLKRPSWSRTIIAGGTMGLAELTKTTLGVFFVVWPAIWFFWRVSERGRSSPPAWCFQFLQLATALAIPVYVVNLGYGFEGSFEKLGGIPFTSNALTAKCGQSESSSKTNYFAHKWLGTLRVPFPRNYVLGIDVQWREFEEKDWSYLNGEWRRGGWWFYYIYALVVKEPLGTWALVIMAAAMGIAGRPCRFSWRDEIFLLVPACVVLAIVSLQTGFNHHMRYVLPVLPFVFVWTAKVACSVNRAARALACLASAAAAWSVASSLWIYPHNLSYFNEAVGGPMRGHAHLLGSNIDWGQDLVYLKLWLERHAEVRRIALAYSLPRWLLDPRDVGIDYSLPPAGPKTQAGDWPVAEGEAGPLSGWFAISVARLRDRDNQYAYFLRFKPVATAGYSIYVYHITPEDANRVRRELSMPLILH